MYCDLDVHQQTYVDPLTDLLEAVKPEGEEKLEISHPGPCKTEFLLTQHDGRVFKTTITTEEV